MTKVSSSKLAALLMVSEERVRQLANAGVVTKTARNSFELVPSIRGYLRTLRVAVYGQPATDLMEEAAAEFWEQHARADRLEAELAEVKADRT